MSFGGTYRHQIDEKNRMRIPAKLREKLGDEYIITRGTEGCLFVFQTKYFEEVFAPNLEKLPMSDPGVRNAQRFFLGNRYDVEEDKQGRFVIPEELLEKAKIVKNVVTKGVGDRIEIWAQEVHEQALGDLDFNDAVNTLKQYEF